MTKKQTKKPTKQNLNKKITRTKQHKPKNKNINYRVPKEKARS